MSRAYGLVHLVTNRTKDIDDSDTVWMNLVNVDVPWKFWMENAHERTCGLECKLMVVDLVGFTVKNRLEGYVFWTKSGKTEVVVEGRNGGFI